METVDNNYQVYLRSILNLAGTIVFKSHDSALLLNTYIDTYFGNGLYDPYDLSTWKYYKNLSGEYFPTDTIMTVRSSDTLEEIAFTKENLAIHRNTAQDHRFGSPQYKELKERYPMQVQLINGVLYPIDKTALINAKNHTLVGWASEFVEPHEYQLMPAVADYIEGYLDRWLVEGFKYTDELYLAALYAGLTMSLPQFILAERAAAHKTQFAHSYHVNMYLGSHSRMADYSDYMTRSQQMFAYRNIAFIERNSGMQENFDWLIQNLMTTRSVPLAKFDMRHDVSAMPDELTATLAFKKEPLNTRVNVDGRDSYTLSQLMSLQERVDPANISDRDLHQEEAIRNLVYANRDAMPTKVFESSVIDYTDSEKNRWVDVALNNWAWLARKKIYTSYIAFQAPSSGATITVNVSDAFALYIYCFIRSYGYDITEVPKFYLNRCAKIKPATKADLRSVCSHRVSDEYLDVLLQSMPSMRKYVSVQAFNQYSRELFRAANRQWYVAASCEGSMQRAMVENAGNMLWCDAVVDFADYKNQSYTQWFAERNIDMSIYNQEELREIASLILSKALGDDFNDKTSLKSVQRAMVNILTGLSSYSIQIGATINDGPILPGGAIGIRGEDWDSRIQSILYAKLSRLTALSVESSIVHEHDCELKGLFISGQVSVAASSEFYVEIPAIPSLGSRVDNNISFEIVHNLNIGMEATIDAEPLPPGTPKTFNVPGLSQWLTMPQEFRNSAKSTWHKPT